MQSNILWESRNNVSHGIASSEGREDTFCLSTNVHRSRWHVWWYCSGERFLSTFSLLWDKFLHAAWMSECVYTWMNADIMSSSLLWSLSDTQKSVRGENPLGGELWRNVWWIFYFDTLVRWTFCSPFKLFCWDFLGVFTINVIFKSSFWG